MTSLDRILRTNEVAFSFIPRRRAAIKRLAREKWRIRKDYEELAGRVVRRKMRSLRCASPNPLAKAGFGLVSSRTDPAIGLR